MRAFIAVDFPLQVKRAIISFRNTLVNKLPKVSWTREENLHLTLKFLGNIKSEEEIKRSIEKVSSHFRSFPITISKPGIFRKNQQMIFYLSILPVDQIITLIDKIESETRKIGYMGQRQIPIPHVTFGRGKNFTKRESISATQYIAKTNIVNPPSFYISEVTLFASTLMSSGPIYTPRERFRLCS